MALSAPDARRFPWWLAVTAGASSAGLVIWVAVGVGGPAPVQAAFDTIAAFLAVALFWLCRHMFRATLAKPLPRRGPDRWIVSLPGWQMVGAKLASAIVLLALGDVVLSLLHVRGAGVPWIAGTSALTVPASLAQAVAWRELRDRPGPAL